MADTFHRKSTNTNTGTAIQLNVVMEKNVAYDEMHSSWEDEKSLA